MAKTLFQVHETDLPGMNVYVPFTPQKPGRIIRVIGRLAYADGSPSQSWSVEVKWVDGKVDTHSTSHLSDFDALIADHKKKLATHEKSLARLKETMGETNNETGTNPAGNSGNDGQTNPAV